MRTYQNTAKDKKPNKKRSNKLTYGILLAIGVIIIATVITLSLVLTNKPAVTDELPPDDGQHVVTPPPAPGREFTAPMLSFTVGQQASLTRVVYSSSMNNWRTHNGIDFLAAANSEVLAISSGKVISIEHTVLEGTVVAVDHGDGIVSYYKGLNKKLSVAVNAEVGMGDVIGTIAEVMPLERNVGAHLHLEIKLNNKLVDPLNYLPDLGDK